MMINNTLKEDIIQFFSFLSKQTNQFITAIELEPIKIKENMYISGFKRNSLIYIQAHVQSIETYTIKNNDFSMEIKRKTEPKEEIWMDIELLSQDVVNVALNAIKQQFRQLTSYDVLKMEYREKTTHDTDYIIKEEIIIFTNKQQACKTAIKKRKECTQIRTKFMHYGLPQTTTVKTVTDEEFAEMEM